MLASRVPPAVLLPPPRGSVVSSAQILRAPPQTQTVAGTVLGRSRRKTLLMASFRQARSPLICETVNSVCLRHARVVVAGARVPEKEDQLAKRPSMCTCRRDDV